MAPHVRSDSLGGQLMEESAERSKRLSLYLVRLGMAGSCCVATCKTNGPMSGANGPGEATCTKPSVRSFDGMTGMASQDDPSALLHQRFLHVPSVATDSLGTNRAS